MSPRKTESIEAPTVTAVVKRRDILSRRLQNPFGTPSQGIPCKDKDRQGKPLLVFHIVNEDLYPGRVRSSIDAGWEFATKDQIIGNPEDYGFEERSGRLVRGERGKEVLISIPRGDYDLIQQAKAAKNLAAVSGRATKNAIVERASAELGDEGASFLHQTIKNVEITDTRERMPADEL